MTRILTVLILLLIAPPAAADAKSVRDFYVRELREDGYSEIRITKTWLGRMRIVAMKPGSRREIVVNPVTGLILRDYIRTSEADGEEVSGTGQTGGGGSSGGGGGSGNDDDDDDDDDNDDGGGDDGGGDDGGDDDGDDD